MKRREMEKELEYKHVVLRKRKRERKREGIPKNRMDKEVHGRERERRRKD